MRMVRVFAQVIDLLVGLGALVFSFLVALPALSPFLPEGLLPPLVGLLCSLLLAFGIQYPFLGVNQTVGKGFFGLEVISTDPKRPLSLSILLQREIFLKLMTCYLICIPVLFGGQGGHEVATNTKVEKKRKRPKNETQKGAL